jgi:hypothetical protein
MLDNYQPSAKKPYRGCLFAISGMSGISGSFNGRRLGSFSAKAVERDADACDGGLGSNHLLMPQDRKRLAVRPAFLANVRLR